MPEDENVDTPPGTIVDMRYVEMLNFDVAADILNDAVAEAREAERRRNVLYHIQGHLDEIYQEMNRLGMTVDTETYERALADLLNRVNGENNYSPNAGVIDSIAHSPDGASTVVNVSLEKPIRRKMYVADPPTKDTQEPGIQDGL